MLGLDGAKLTIYLSHSVVYMETQNGENMFSSGVRL